MLVRALAGGPTQSVGYLAYDHGGGTAIVIDTPPGAWKRYVRLLSEHRLTCPLIVNTHGHWDQIADNLVLAKATGASICAHSWDSARMADPRLTMEEHDHYNVTGSRADRSLHDEEVLEVGDLRLLVLHTPGHSPGSICLYEERAGALFSGDTLLSEATGRTDIPGGNRLQLSRSLLRLGALPPRTMVYPAHGLPTTIGSEEWIFELAKSESI